MKRLIRLLLCLVTFAAHYGASAQTITTHDSPFPQDSCGGFAVVNNPSGLSDWSWYDENNNLLQVGGDTLYGLCPGNYSIGYTSGGGPGTEYFSMFLGLCYNSAISATINALPSTGTCDGAATATILNGTAPYSYFWTDINGLQTTTPTISGLCPGVYVNLTVYDANGCAATDVATITNACAGFSVIVFSNPATATCDGDAYASVASGTAPYAFSWSNGATTQSITGLCSGNYSVTVIDQNGCIASQLTTVTEGCATMGVTAYGTPVQTLGGCDGEIFTEVYGIDSAPYTYFFGGATLTATGNTSNFTGQCPGTYAITITAANGCTVTTAATVDPDPCANLAINGTSNPVTDAYTCNGAVSVSASGGVQPYAYTLNGSPYSGFSNFMCAGTYTATVIDNNGCADSMTLEIVDSSAFYCSFPVTIIGTPSTDPINCNGTLTASATGGTGGYQYLWSISATTQVITGLCDATYSVFVYDANGCTGIAEFTLESPAGPSTLSGYVSSTDETDDGLCDGTAEVVVNGGTAPYQYFQSNGSATAAADSLCAGDYSVLVIDANGDSLVIDYLISTPGNVIINTPYPDSTVIDSLWNDLVENCTIDYGSIDSAYIDTASWFAADSIAITWAIYDTNGVSYVTQNYYFGGGNGVYAFVLSVFCPQKSTGQFLKVYDQVYLSDALGLAEQETLPVTVYPNPFSEQVNIAFGKAGDYSVVLCDMTGRVLLQQSAENAASATLNGLEGLAKGEYLLHITGNTGTVTRKLVK